MSLLAINTCVVEVSARAKYNPSPSETSKIHIASLVYCRYEKGQIYVLKNRLGDRGYFSETGFNKLKFEILYDEVVGDKWRTKEKIAIILENEKRVI